MSTKTLTWGLFGAAPRQSAAAGSSNPTNPINRRAVVMARPGANARARSHGWALPRRDDLKTYIGVALAAAVVLMFLVYIFGINQSAAKGYEITKQKNKFDALVDSNKKLMVKTAEVGSIVKIQDEAMSDHLVQITGQEYLQANQLTQR